MSRRTAVVVGVLATLSLFVPQAWAAPVDPQASASHAGTIVATVSEDAYAIPDLPTETTGGYGVVMVGDAAADGRVGYLKFRLSGLPAGAQVTATELIFRATDPDPGTATVQVLSTNPDWSEASLDADNAPPPEAPVGAGTVSAGDDTTISLGGWVSGNGTYAFALRLTSSDPSKLSIASTESTYWAPARMRVEYDTAGTDPCSSAVTPTTSCGVFVGSTVNAMEGAATRTAVVRRLEDLWGRDVAVVHTYHTNGEVFPSDDEIALTTDPSHPRLLAVNWKPSTSNTWAQVAQGVVDDRIDAAAARLAAYGHPVFLAIQHEPEDSVLDVPGSGRTPADYVAMFRHVVQQIRADGATNVGFVWDMMGYKEWGASGLYDRLYPGDDVVDWIAADPYGADLASLLTRTEGDWPGWYAWATTQHPGKPLALFEFGMPNPRMSLQQEAAAYTSLADQARQFPWLRMALHFNHGTDGVTVETCRYDDDPTTMRAWRSMVNDPYLEPPIP